MRAIIYDAVKDFNRSNNMSVDKELFAGIILSRNVWTEPQYSKEDIYALISNFLYYVKVRYDDADMSDMKIIEESFNEFLSAPEELLIERSESYKWIPEALEKVYRDGERLFEMAKDAYFENRSPEKTKEAEALLGEMTAARAILETEDCVYRNIEDIILMYEEEMSESQLDADIIREESMFISFRLSEYINYMAELGGGMPDSFEVPPFSAPESLFDDETC